MYIKNSMAWGGGRWGRGILYYIMNKYDMRYYIQET